VRDTAGGHSSGRASRRPACDSRGPGAQPLRRGTNASKTSLTRAAAGQQAAGPKWPPTHMQRKLPVPSESPCPTLLSVPSSSGSKTQAPRTRTGVVRLAPTAERSSFAQAHRLPSYPSVTRDRGQTDVRSQQSRVEAERHARRCLPSLLPPVRELTDRESSPVPRGLPTTAERPSFAQARHCRHAHRSLHRRDAQVFESRCPVEAGRVRGQCGFPQPSPTQLSQEFAIERVFTWADRQHGPGAFAERAPACPNGPQSTTLPESRPSGVDHQGVPATANERQCRRR